LKIVLPGGTNSASLSYSIEMNLLALSPWHFSQTSPLQMAPLQALLQARAAGSGLEVVRLIKSNCTTHLMCSKINVVSHQWFIVIYCRKQTGFLLSHSHAKNFFLLKQNKTQRYFKAGWKGFR